MVPLNTQDGASQHPGWCLATPRMVPLNTQDGPSQHPGWSLSTPRMVPLNTQDGVSQHPGWCPSTPRMVPLNTQDGASQQQGWCLCQDGASQHPGWCLCQHSGWYLYQHSGWCLLTPRMVPLNTQDGASQHPGWCLCQHSRWYLYQHSGWDKVGCGSRAFGRVGTREHFFTLGFPPILHPTLHLNHVHQGSLIHNGACRETAWDAHWLSDQWESCATPRVSVNYKHLYNSYYFTKKINNKTHSYSLQVILQWILTYIHTATQSLPPAAPVGAYFARQSIPYAWNLKPHPPLHRAQSNNL